MNNLKMDLTNKIVLVRKEVLKPDITDRRFLCEAGFGLYHKTNGRQIYGKWLCDNTDGNITGHDIECLAETQSDIIVRSIEKEALEIENKNK
jgi:hypothetical protein